MREIQIHKASLPILCRQSMLATLFVFITAIMNFTSLANQKIKW